MEGREHGFHLLAAAAGALRRQAGRQARRDRRDRTVEVRRFRQQDFEPIDPPDSIERQLRRGDVHQHEVAVEHPRRALVLQHATDDVVAHAIADHQADRAADLEAAAPRQLLGDHDRSLVGQDLEKLLRRDAVRWRRADWWRQTFRFVVSHLEQLVIPERLVAQDVDAENLDGLQLAPRQRLDVADHERGAALDDRAHAAVFAQPPERRQQRLVEPGAAGDDLDGGLAGHGLERPFEAAHRAGVGELDRHHHRDPQRHADHGGRGAELLLQQRPDDEAGEQPSHVLSVATNL